MPTELTDPLVYDFDRLREIASEPIVKRGIAYFKENRVIEFDTDGAHIWARVEGSRPDSPYMVELGHDADGELLVQCDCPFDWGAGVQARGGGAVELWRGRDDRFPGACRRRGRGDRGARAARAHRGPGQACLGRAVVRLLARYLGGVGRPSKTDLHRPDPLPA